MKVNKPKSACAYVKNCKKKEKDQEKVFDHSITPQEHLYDDLLDELELEDSQYIRKICKKNQGKKNKLEQKESTLINSSTSRKNVNKNYEQKQQPIQNHIYLTQVPAKQIAMDFMQTKPSKSSFAKIKQQTVKKTQKIIKNPYSSDDENILKSNKSSFLHNIDDYLVKLKSFQSQKSNKQKNESRQLRKTVQMKTNTKASNSAKNIFVKKFSSLFDKWEEEVQIREYLQQKIQSDNIKIYKMKHIIKNMMREISSLNEQLDEERMIREKYQNISAEFIHKICHTSVIQQRRTQGKEQSRLQKTNNASSASLKSYNGKERDERRYYLGNTDYLQGRFSFKTKDSFEYKQNKNDYSTLKKQKHRHRYNMSQNFIDMSRQPFRQKVSIYNDMQ